MAKVLTTGPRVSYEPRQSTAIASDFAQADGDVWQEKLAVCETSTADGHPKLVIRSYYRNDRTTERCWDEPPSGASQVNHATPDMRRIVHDKMTEMQLTLDMIPPDPDPVPENPKSATGKKGGKGFFGLFGGRKKEKKSVEVSKDLNLQRAIARSMADQGGPSTYSSRSPNDCPIVLYEPSPYNEVSANRVNGDYIDEDDDPDMALAKALSIFQLQMNENLSSSSVGLSEDDMFQRAIEASRLPTDNPGAEQNQQQPTSATNVARMPEHTSSDDYDQSSSHHSDYPLAWKKDPNESFRSDS